MTFNTGQRKHIFSSINLLDHTQNNCLFYKNYESIFDELCFDSVHRTITIQWDTSMINPQQNLNRDMCIKSWAQTVGT